MLLILPLAHAVDCPAAQVTSTLPEDGATGVPLDARPVAFVDDVCVTAPTWDLTLLRASDEGVVASEHVDAVYAYGLLQFTGDFTLEPDTGYVLRVEADDGSGSVTEVTFTSGTEPRIPLSGRLSAHVDAAWWDRPTGSVVVEWGATPIADPEGLSIVWIMGGALDTAAAMPATDVDDAMTTRFVLAEPGDPVVTSEPFCGDVGQDDGAGNMVDWVLLDCVELAGGGGCGGNNGTPDAMGILFLVGPLIRARRR